jgi:hypothetical protein
VSGVDELVRWLGDQLDEDERIARAAAEETEAKWDSGNRYLSDSVDEASTGAPVVIGTHEYLDWSVRQFIAAHDPARVLREIDSTRQMLVRCEEAMMAASTMLVHFAKQTVREMALPYADREGYEEVLYAFG